MKCSTQVVLDQCNTMRLPCVARFVLTLEHEHEIATALHSVTAQRFRPFILGGGSNILMPPQLDALVIRPQLRGVRLLAERGDELLIEAMAGEPWHDFVQYTVAQGWYGLENLSLIPGTVGACPIQNVGAYGVEVADRLHSVTAYHRPSRQFKTLRPADCAFAYRDSVFKQQADDWLISRVVFRLSRKANIRLDYGDVRQLAGRYPTPQSVAAAICQIRASKLPDPAKIANTGSFFKNPLVSAAHYQQLKQQFAQIGGYAQADGSVKLAAGWLIDQAGWRGRRLGAVGMYEKQALVLVNHGGGHLADVLALAEAVQHDVWQKFAVRLQREPVLVSSLGVSGLVVSMVDG